VISLKIALVRPWEGGTNSVLRPTDPCGGRSLPTVSPLIRAFKCAAEQFSRVSICFHRLSRMCPDVIRRDLAQARGDRGSRIWSPRDLAAARGDHAGYAQAAGPQAPGPEPPADRSRDRRPRAITGGPGHTGRRRQRPRRDQGNGETSSGPGASAGGDRLPGSAAPGGSGSTAAASGPAPSCGAGSGPIPGATAAAGRRAEGRRGRPGGRRPAAVATAVSRNRLRRSARLPGGAERRASRSAGRGARRSP
jgi:hypothetical protein